MQTTNSHAKGVSVFCIPVFVCKTLGTAVMKTLDGRYVSLKLSPPHTWHAAEIFLILINTKY